MKAAIKSEKKFCQSNTPKIHLNFVNNFLEYEKNFEKPLKSKKEKTVKRIINKESNKNKYYRSFIKMMGYIILFKYIILIDLFLILKNNIFRKIELNFSNITIKIKGVGNNYVLGYHDKKNKFSRQYFPDEIYINEIKQDTINYRYYFNETNNIVTLKWYNNINNSQNMFRECSNITEIDFSNFDSSEVLDMSIMFYNCSSLTFLNLYNFDTSQVTLMSSMFEGCSSLTSLNLSNFKTSKVSQMNNTFFGCSKMTFLNLSNFDTSQVVSMTRMFEGCSSLLSLDLSSFNTSKLLRIYNIFRYCNSLTSLNISNFDISQVSQIDNIFEDCKSLEYINLKKFNESKLESRFSLNLFKNVPDNVVICIDVNINQNIIFPQIKNKSCYTIDCSDNWRISQKKIINGTGQCVESCENTSLHKYEYGGKCYHCPYGLTEENKCKCKLEKCLLCSEEALNKSLCTKCNVNYYPKENDSLNIDEFFNCYQNLSGYYLDTNESLFKKCYSSCKTCETKGDEINHNCLTCKENFIYEDIISNYKNCYNNISFYDFFYINKSDHISYSGEINTIIENRKENIIYNENKMALIFESSSNSQVIYECLLNDSINNLCSFINITNNDEVLNIIRENILSIYNKENEKSQVIQGKGNVIYQITNEKNELELLKGDISNNHNISIIDLGQCGTKLKNIYHLNENDSFIYIKQENISCKASEKNIKYEVYEPYNYSKVNLSICDKDNINIYVKAELSSGTKEVYQKLKEMGYDMLNINDPFYQDICTPYESSNDTDIILSDRINYIYYNEDSQCQSNCYFSSYLSNSLYLNCTCEVVEENENKESKFNGKKLYESFYGVLIYANFDILKCHNLVFSKNIIKKNIGSIIIMIIFTIYLISLIIYIIKGIAPLKEEIKNILIKEEENIKKPQILIFNINKKEKQSKQNKKKKKKLSSPPLKRGLTKKAKTNKILNNKIIKNQRQQKKSKTMNLYETNRNGNKTMKRNLLASSNIINISKNKEKLSLNEDINKRKNEVEVSKTLDAFELNELEYDEAITQDKRTFIQTYFDLLSREHQLIFTFFMCNDYNLSYIKFARFIFLLVSDMAMNVFFFSDDSMHKIFLNYGKYNFIQQIPQIVYTTIVSQLLEIFLSFLSLTDSHIYKIKNTNKPTKIMVLKILRCLQLKLLYFFIFTFIIFGLYWYIVTAFCAVYQNTQIIFLKDSLSSFLLGLLYPFVLYLLPTALRILSLRQSKLGLKCIYKLSDIIPFF